MTTKVVYNSCYGGFSISTAALKRMKEIGFKGDAHVYKGLVALYNFERHDPA